MDLNNNKGDLDFFNFVQQAVMNMNRENKFDNVIDPSTNATEDGPPQGLLLIRIKQFVVFPDEDNQQSSTGPISDPMLPGFQLFGELNKMFEEIGILDLSGKNLTGKYSFYFSNSYV